MRVVAALLIAGLAAGIVVPGGGCMEPEPRGSLKLRLRGPVYPRARCAKGPAAMGKHHPGGDPVAGARVTLSPGGFSGTTDAEGELTFKDLPRGDYTLAISAPAYRAPDKQPTASVRSGEATLVTQSLDSCVFGGGNRYNVGFETQITLTAAPYCDAWKDAAYTWAQLEGPELATGDARGWNRQQLVFTTARLTQLRALPKLPQLLSFSPDQAGQYVFSVTARNKQGLVAKDYVYVTATSVANGVNSVPPDERFYFCGEEQGPWEWEITTWPKQLTATLTGEKTRTPSIYLSSSGDMLVQETVVISNKLSSTQPFSLVVGNWDMVNRDCGTKDCHPPLQKSWEATRHGSTWKKLLDGELKSARARPAEDCATCHAIGFNRASHATNGGYDENVDMVGATFPEVFKQGTYAKLDQEVKDVSNVYCVACHGPARVDPPMAEQPGRFEAGVCARCHDRKPEQDLVAQWRTSRMAKTIRAELNGPESKAECTRCHSSQGFYYTNFALGRPPNTGVVVMSCCENLAPITCQTCHSPMYAKNKAQIFRYDAVETGSGLKLKGIGAGALCSMCHNTDHDVSQASTLSQRLAPHSPQADLSYGRGGYVLAAKGYPTPKGAACARDAGEGCANCHMHKGPAYGKPGYRQVGDHTFHMISSGGVDNVLPCQGCHPTMESFDPLARGDYDGSGGLESVRKEVDGLLALLKQHLSAAIAKRGFTGCDAARSRGSWIKAGFRLKVVVTDELGFDLGDCDRSGEIERTEQAFVFPAADLLLHKAAYNYLFIASDKSRGLHNVPYAVILLQRTLVALTGGEGLPRWDIFAAKPD
jgi:hypothetical protein